MKMRLVTFTVFMPCEWAKSIDSKVKELGMSGHRELRQAILDWAGYDWETNDEKCDIEQEVFIKL